MIFKNFLEIHLNARKKKTRFQKDTCFFGSELKSRSGSLWDRLLLFFWPAPLSKLCRFSGSEKAEAGPSGTSFCFFFGARLSQNSVVFLAPKKQNQVPLGPFWKQASVKKQDSVPIFKPKMQQFEARCTLQPYYKLYERSQIKVVNWGWEVLQKVHKTSMIARFLCLTKKNNCFYCLVFPWRKRI